MQDIVWIALLLGLLAATLAYVRLCDNAWGAANMTLDLWLAGFTATGLLLYLVAVLLRPERFW